MITNYPAYAQFEQDLIARQLVDPAQNFRIVDALYNEAVALGIFPLKEPLEGLDAILTIAKVVNSVSGTPHPART
jgi:hypothetical protein